MFIKLQSKQMQWLFPEYTTKILIYKTFDLIQSNPEFFSKISTQSNPIQSMHESNPRPTLVHSTSLQLFVDFAAFRWRLSVF